MLYCAPADRSGPGAAVFRNVIYRRRSRPRQDCRRPVAAAAEISTCCAVRRTGRRRRSGIACRPGDVAIPEVATAAAEPRSPCSPIAAPAGWIDTHRDQRRRAHIHPAGRRGRTAGHTACACRSIRGSWAALNTHASSTGMYNAIRTSAAWTVTPCQPSALMKPLGSCSLKIGPRSATWTRSPSEKHQAALVVRCGPPR